MHGVTGGAYNGKSAWVREHYQLNTRTDYKWITAYRNQDWPHELAEFQTNLLVLEGVEQWILQWLEMDNSRDPRVFGRDMISMWMKWEQKKSDRQLVIIGTDISKGIVPVDQQMRKWRDLTGWFYQDLVEKCDRLDVIWYGINKQLK